MRKLSKQFKSKTLPHAIHIALAGLAVAPWLLPAQAQAQDADAPMQRVEITGSNIRRADVETPSPVQVLTLQDLKASGYTSVSDVLREITANGSGTLSQSFNTAFAAGASGISLRGLSVGATLVLVDGHRMAPYALSDDGQRSFVDISQIPFEAIERIEVLKDGASSIYGSDAMAGVVNVILKKHFTGAEISAEGGQSSHHDGQTEHVSGIYGWGDLVQDGHNAYLAVEYRHQNKILVTDRNEPFTQTDWSALGGNNLTRGVPNAINGGQPGSLTGYLLDPNSGAMTMLPGCTAAQLAAAQCAYKDKDLELQPETKNINVMGSYLQKLGDNWQLNLKASVFQSDAEQLGRYETTGGNVGGLSALAFGPGVPPTVTPAGGPVYIMVPSTYPGNTTGSSQILQYNFPELGGGRTGVQSQTVRLVAELTGTVGKWDITAAAGHTENTVKQTIEGEFNIANLQAAFNDPLHPYLIGAAASGNSAALLAQIAPTEHAKATDILQFVSVGASRELMDLPGGALAISLGTDFTHRELNAPAPATVADGEQMGNNAWAIGNQNIAAAYGELVAPLLSNLELDASLRHDQVNGIGHATTPKIGLKYAPVKQVTLRGTYTEGFRAPNPAESGNTGSYFGGNLVRDPQLCANGQDGQDLTTVPGNYPQQCAVALGGVQLAGQHLKPETSKSYTFGLILEPSKQFNLSADYYNIRIDNQIISTYSDPTYDPTPYIVRGQPVAQPYVLPDGTLGSNTPAVGNMIFAPYPYENADTTRTSGVDLDARWTLALGEGTKLTTELNETHMISYKQTTPGSAAVELAGTHGPSGVSGDTGNPRDRAQLIITLEHGPLTVTGTANWISSYSVIDPTTPSAMTCTDAIANGSSAFDVAPSQFCSVKNFATFDLFGSYQVNKQLQVHASVTNLFGRSAPLDFQTYGGAQSTFYNPALHQDGAVGRFFNIGATYKF